MKTVSPMPNRPGIIVHMDASTQAYPQPNMSANAMKNSTFVVCAIEKSNQEELALGPLIAEIAQRAMTHPVQRTFEAPNLSPAYPAMSFVKSADEFSTDIINALRVRLIPRSAVRKTDKWSKKVPTTQEIEK
mmetsp:Transcript_29032/g.112877  ORF Transcript_29032/g.112877 Transcript_29032/m.112877 type:complete len:132 (+) Transcript_29032:2114-2509(+)